MIVVCPRESIAASGCTESTVLRSRRRPVIAVTPSWGSSPWGPSHSGRESPTADIGKSSKMRTPVHPVSSSGCSGGGEEPFMELVAVIRLGTRLQARAAVRLTGKGC